MKQCTCMPLYQMKTWSNVCLCSRCLSTLCWHEAVYIFVAGTCPPYVDIKHCMSLYHAPVHPLLTWSSICLCIRYLPTLCWETVYISLYQVSVHPVLTWNSVYLCTRYLSTLCWHEALYVFVSGTCPSSGFGYLMSVSDPCSIFICYQGNVINSGSPYRCTASIVYNQLITNSAIADPCGVCNAGTRHRYRNQEWCIRNIRP